MKLKESYPKDTLGYHYLNSREVFGENSRPTMWLKGKAEKAPNGFDEKVVAPESQVVFVLGRMYLEETEGS